jgi:hypothetical protein
MAMARRISEYSCIAAAVRLRWGFPIRRSQTLIGQHVRRRPPTRIGRAIGVAHAVTVGVMLLTAACSGATPRNSTDAVSSTHSAPQSIAESSSPTIATFADVDGHHVRQCTDAIAVIPDSGRTVLSARFLDIDSAADIGSDELSPDREGRLTIHKFVLQIPQSAGLIAVSVSPRDRDVAGLSYDPQQWAAGTVRIRDAAHTLVVEKCAGGDAQYNGGFVVDGARCVHLRVQDLHTKSVESQSLPFGTMQCT